MLEINLPDEVAHGRRPIGGLGRRLPPKFEVGDSSCIRPDRPPNILISTVIGCEAKYELTEKRVSRRNIFV